MIAEDIKFSHKDTVKTVTSADSQAPDSQQNTEEAAELRRK